MAGVTLSLLKLRGDRSGATAAEYALLLAIVGGLMVGATWLLGRSVGNQMNSQAALFASSADAGSTSWSSGSSTGSSSSSTGSTSSTGGSSTTGGTTTGGTTSGSSGNNGSSGSNSNGGGKGNNKP